jgi:hypothetical protein
MARPSGLFEGSAAGKLEAPDRAGGEDIFFGTSRRGLSANSIKYATQIVEERVGLRLVTKDHDASVAEDNAGKLASGPAQRFQTDSMATTSPDDRQGPSRGECGSRALMAR